MQIKNRYILLNKHLAFSYYYIIQYELIDSRLILSALNLNTIHEIIITLRIFKDIAFVLEKYYKK